MNIIKQKREEFGLSQADLGKKLNVSQQHINRFENDYPIPLKHIPKLATILNIDIHDLLPEEFKNVNFKTNKSKESIIIDMLDTTACCGNGVENISENVIGFWQMPLNEYRHITFANPDNIKMLRVYGDSMEPTLSDGDWVLVDISKNFIDSDGIFLIRMSSGLAVKRIQNTIGKAVVVKSDNSKYDNITADIGNVAIVGKVIYTLKTEKVG